MFEIDFRVVDDFDMLSSISMLEFDEEWTDIEGFFSLNFDGNVYGYFHDNELQEYETGPELLTLWFSLLLETIEQLHQNGYIALKVIETNETWLEFRIEDQFLVVSLARQKVNLSNEYLITEDRLYFTYPNWKDVRITYEDFENEVRNKTLQYIAKLRDINKNLVETRVIRRLFSQLNSICKYS